MLSDNSNKIRSVKKKPFLLAGGKKGRPTLLHNGINGQKGGKNTKGTSASLAKIKEDPIAQASKALKKKR
jgi:hypothetical protein